MSFLFNKIDELTRPDHSFLEEGDHCFYLGEYTAGGGYAAGFMNDLILNLKKPTTRRSLPEWHYKERAIASCSTALSRMLGQQEWIKNATLVPLPPSKAKGDPLYDDRMVQVLDGVRSSFGEVDVRELVLTQASRDAAHASDGHRPRPEDHVANLIVNPACISPPPVSIGLCDDVLVTGSLFKGAQQVLAAAFPEVSIVGVFIARRVPID